jgi:hypothetical protein
MMCGKREVEEGAIDPVTQRREGGSRREGERDSEEVSKVGGRSTQ